MNNKAEQEIAAFLSQKHSTEAVIKVCLHIPVASDLSK